MYLLFRLLRKLRILQYLIFRTHVKHEGKSVVVPLYGGLGIENVKTSEKWMLSLLEKLALGENETIVDVGVNLGQTLIKVKSIYPSCEYVGFEPNPLCVNYVESLISSNHWQKTILLPVAISQESGVVELKFYTNSQTDSCASIVPDFREDKNISMFRHCLTCTEKELEKIFVKKKISLIKIDVEGAELDVFQGLYGLIKRDRPYLIVEILPVYSERNEERLKRQENIEKIISALGYVKYRILKDENGNLLGYDEILSIGIHANLDWCDYLFSQVPIQND